MEYFITCGAIPVYVSDTKKGERTVVLLHGYLETLAVWEDFVHLLAPHFRVLRIDLPGHGLSGTNSEVNTVDFSAMILCEVLQKSGVSEAIVAGHSMGGYIAQAFAENYPEAVLGLSFFHSTPNPDSEEKKKDRDREIALIREGKISLIAKQSFSKMFAKKSQDCLKEKITELEELAEIHDPEGIVACLEGMKTRPDRNNWLATFKKPLLFVFGKKDEYIPEETAQNIAAKFPQGQVLWLENSGHCGFIEEQDVVADRFIEFVRSI